MVHKLFDAVCKPFILSNFWNKANTTLLSFFSVSQGVAEEKGGGGGIPNENVCERFMMMAILLKTA